MVQMKADYCLHNDRMLHAYISKRTRTHWNIIDSQHSHHAHQCESLPVFRVTCKQKTPTHNPAAETYVSACWHFRKSLLFGMFHSLHLSLSLCMYVCVCLPHCFIQEVKFQVTACQDPWSLCYQMPPDNLL